ncbi:hypothetical protein N7474_003864 [Penicillium riverlandense]|uniref:uncharacterized protein n=1 Tax=Penicillium riverlandense TaxID=1903569 RepID=UPI0025478D77|nr:uncharacterized protein N7474_003864 [Penicillium riverlandense]KAJ5818273.1 hypothetical protein N7474_003864 [Penicillium riverlandense]
MASMSALPQPSRPATNPPTGSLPPLPKPRKTSTASPTDATRAASPASKLRAPSSPRPSLVKSPLSNSNSTSNLNAARSVSTGRGPSSPDKTLRRTISIASFPQPPKPATVPTPAGGGKAKRGSRLSTGTTSSFRSSKTPSLLNGSGDGKSILSSDARDLDASPAHSRSSSAQGSCSTSATTFEDGDDTATAGKTNSKPKEIKGNVLVSVRVRPEANTGSETPRTHGEWAVDGRQSLISYRGKEGGEYYYDNVFTANENNAKVYDSGAKRLVRRVMEGYHGTVFAYGMTGTGKTFSMQGTATSPGVIPLAITDIFSFIRETPHREFLLRVSYLEIYNEKIHDLLSASMTANGTPAPQQEEIKLREDSKRGVYASPLKEEIVQSPTQLLRVIARGDHARRTSSTQFNARSSRSHAVVQIVVESRERAPTGNSQDKRAGIAPGGVRVSTLSLIDLAGSERAADDKERRTEGAHINKSLLTLGNIISRLSDNKDKQGNPADREGRHLPYRDSKLTRLLQPALSGNSLVSILCTIQCATGVNAHTGETLNTLKFAARAKNNIVSHAKKAEEAYGAGGGDGSRVLLERYRMEIQALRGQLDTQSKDQAEKELKLEAEQYEKEAQTRHDEQVLEMQLARTALKERIEHLNRLILSSKSTGVNSHNSLSAFGRLSGLSTGTRSLRSSASQSTLGAGHSSIRPISFMSVNSNDPSVSMPYSVNEDDDDMGEFGDGRASLQRQVSALQADLGDKNRYISTLERRLLQARRSSHSRISVGMKANNPSTISEHPDMTALLREKDMEINELRLQLDDKDRMLTALRSATRHRDLAVVTNESQSPTELKSKVNSPSDADGSTPATNGMMGKAVSPSAASLKEKGQEKEKEKENEKEGDKKKNMDEVSRMLDEMIQGRVVSGQSDSGSRGSIHVTGGGRRESASAEVAALRSSPFEKPVPGAQAIGEKGTGEKKTIEEKTTEEKTNGGQATGEQAAEEKAAASPSS